jgi:uncharacterized protein
MFSAVAMLVPPAAYALERVDLYRVSIPVADTSEAAADAAAREALAEVLVRMTGEAAARSDELASTLAGQVERLITQRGYVNLPGRINPQGELEPARTALEVRFDPEALRAALTESGRSAWSPVRPVTLVALGIGRGGGFEWVTQEDAAGYADLLRASAARRGLPLRLPVTSPPTAIIAAGDAALEPALAALAAGRQAEAVLLGVVEQAADGSATVGWRLRSSDGITRWNGQGADLGLAVDTGLDTLAQKLRERSQPVAAASSGDELFAIVGVGGLADWARLWPRLQQVEGGRSLRIVRLEGDRVWLATGIPGGAQALMLDPAVADVITPDGDAWRLLP